MTGTHRERFIASNLLILGVAAFLARGCDGASQATLVKLDVSTYPSARCLDGSPGGFYWRPASQSENSSRWVFNLEGGGECIDLKSCTERNGTALGGSGQWPKTTQLYQHQSADPKQNPDMHTWNQVFIKYCSGDLHMGLQNATSETLPGLRFSGHRIIEAVLATLQAEDTFPELAKAELVVWSGESAGGLGCVSTVDFVRDSLPGVKYVVGMPLGGFYFSNDAPYNGSDPAPTSYIPWAYSDLETYHTLWSAFVPTRCAASASGGRLWRCMFADTSYHTIASPMFVVESQTDRVVMPLHDGLPALWDAPPYRCLRGGAATCPPDEVIFMEGWSKKMLQSTAAVAASDRDGIFLPACLIHTSFKTSGPLIGGSTIGTGDNFLSAFATWLWGGQNGCAGVIRGTDTGELQAGKCNWIDACSSSEPSVLCNPTC